MKGRRDMGKYWEEYYKDGNRFNLLAKSTEIKRRLIKKALDENTIDSVLDIGCGPIRWLPRFKNYVGVDISECICNVNKSKYPKKKFICGDVIELVDKLPSCDMVLMYSVLIHQETEEKYKQTFDIAFNKAKKLFLFSGYPKRDKPVGVYGAHREMFYYGNVLDLIPKEGVKSLYTEERGHQIYCYLEKEQ